MLCYQKEINYINKKKKHFDLVEKEVINNPKDRRLGINFDKRFTMNSGDFPNYSNHLCVLSSCMYSIIICIV